MSELNEQPEVEVTDDAPPEHIEIPIEGEPDSKAPEASQTEENEEEKKFNPKTDKVEFDTPEQQERFNEVFRQMKKSDQRNQMLTDFLQEAVRQLDEVKGVTNQLKNEKVTQQEQDAENVLVQKLRTAHEEGDNETFVKTLKELQTFGVRREAEKLFDEKVNEFRKQDAVEAGNDAKFVAKAMEETDESGNYIRPWLQENHEQFPIALYQIKKIAGKYEGDPQILAKTLSELDQVMGAQMKKEPPKETPKENQIQSRAPNPMQGTNLTNNKPKGTIKMTRAEADILKKLERHSGKKIDLKKYDARRTAMYDGMNKGGR